jgi:hypothetical protein
MRKGDASATVLSTTVLHEWYSSVPGGFYTKEEDALVLQGKSVLTSIHQLELNTAYDAAEEDIKLLRRFIEEWGLTEAMKDPTLLTILATIKSAAQQQVETDALVSDAQSLIDGKAFHKSSVRDDPGEVSSWSLHGSRRAGTSFAVVSVCIRP